MKRFAGMLGISLVFLAAAESVAHAQGLFSGGLFSRNRGSTVVVAAPHGPLSSPPPVVVTESHVVLRPVVDPFRDAQLRLRSRHNPSRRDGALTLGRIGDPRAVPDLTWLLQNDRDREVREAAALALGAIGDARALNSLRVASLTDRNRRVRQVAHHAHGKILFDAPIIESVRVIDPLPEPEIELLPSEILQSTPRETLPTAAPWPSSVAPASSEFVDAPRELPLPAPLPPPATELDLSPVPVSVPPSRPEPELAPEHRGAISPVPRDDSATPSTPAPPLETPRPMDDDDLL